MFHLSRGRKDMVDRHGNIARPGRMRLQPRPARTIAEHAPKVHPQAGARGADHRAAAARANRRTVADQATVLKSPATITGPSSAATSAARARPWSQPGCGQGQ